MYFFDLEDYYSQPKFTNTSTTWYNYGASWNQVGCSGGGPGFFMDDYFITAGATRDAWLKTLNQWFLSVAGDPTAIAEGYITGPSIDCDCTPDFKTKYLDVQFKYINWEKTREELRRTYKLCRYYYNYGKTLKWQEISPSTEPFDYEGIDPSLAWGGTYEDYKDYIINTWAECATGTTTLDFDISNPYTNYSQSAVTLTINYGTSFEISDLAEKINNYESALKELMCEVKNLVVLILGDMPDGLDANNNVNYEDYKDYYIL